jgi:putative nucleotidyltransferase with HDIG domain
MPAHNYGADPSRSASDAANSALEDFTFAANLVRALDSRDQYSASHSAAVAVYSRDIAWETGCDRLTCVLVHLAGLLHDIGKIGVPNRVLLKGSGLTDGEYETMKDHVEIGARILSDIDRYAQVSILVRHHHERVDGSGYPDGLEGEHIPALARMLAVADTYSAMTTDRPYRDATDPEIAIAELTRERGEQLDSLYVDAFLRVLAREDDDYKRGRSTTFDIEIAKHQTLDQLWTPGESVSDESQAA